MTLLQWYPPGNKGSGMGAGDLAPLEADIADLQTKTDFMLSFTFHTGVAVRIPDTGFMRHLNQGLGVPPGMPFDCIVEYVILQWRDEPVAEPGRELRIWLYDRGSAATANPYTAKTSWEVDRTNGNIVTSRAGTSLEVNSVRLGPNESNLMVTNIGAPEDWKIGIGTSVGVRWEHFGGGDSGNNYGNLTMYLFMREDV